jgi:Deoxyribodipyrimidine photolyase
MTDTLVWFRRDLRSNDHAALHHALASDGRVHTVFVFDPALLDPLPRADRRVEFIRHSLAALDAELRAAGGGLIVRHGDPVEVIPLLARELGVAEVHANTDYEPSAIARDEAVARALKTSGFGWHSWVDQVIFGPDQVRTAGGRPFTVFTPYRSAWLRQLAAEPVPAYPIDLTGRLAPPPPDARVPNLGELGFDPVDGADGAGSSAAHALLTDFLDRIDDYHLARDFPAQPGTSRLSVHLRFGTVSVRELVGVAAERAAAGSVGAESWLSELIWREFYSQLLANFPQVASEAFQPGYDHLEWADGPRADEHFAAWCAGRTGYPLVDAGMRQLNQTGYLHNRLRMVTASFLVKDLGIDWHRGEAYFARQLLDFDLASNNGGWQWTASTGCDAQPYFRIFNPVTQSRRFDPNGAFIRDFVPELAGLDDRSIHAPWLAKAGVLAVGGVRLGVDYPAPIVDHAQARQLTLARYAAARAVGLKPGG